jgi:hypothetical protein
MMLEEEPFGDRVRLSADDVNVGVVGEGEWEWEEMDVRFDFDCGLWARGDGGGEYSC